MSARKLALIVVLGIAAVAGLWAYAHFKSGGTAARELTATTTQGTSFSLSAERGKPVVINFFGSWCGPCNMEAPELAAFAQAHPDVSFVGVANDQPGDADAFMQKYGLTYDVIADPNATILHSWKVTGVPTTVFLNADGTEKARVVGASTRDVFETDLKKAV
jgi:cytochrome c biogenesis protein CcmG/thiol:disulfide interchange protein DsbE